jgi:hypothetical protein
MLIRKTEKIWKAQSRKPKKMSARLETCINEPYPRLPSIIMSSFVNGARLFRLPARGVEEAFESAEGEASSDPESLDSITVGASRFFLDAFDGGVTSIPLNEPKEGSIGNCEQAKKKGEKIFFRLSRSE